MEYIKRIREIEKKKASDRRIKLNVGGVLFETWSSTLERISGTRLALLAHLGESDDSFDREKGEYFFDRHPGAFMSILHYYRTEELHTDQNICGNIIKGELEFWGLTELDIEPCCWGHYSKFKDHKETLAALDDNFTEPDLEVDAWGDKPSSLTKFKRQMWQLLEEPSSSRGAKIYAAVSMFFVILSIATFCLETYHLFRVPVEGATPINQTKLYILPDDDDSCRQVIYGSTYSFADTRPHVSMQVLDYICAAYFSIEFLLRFFFAPKKLLFFKKPLNIIDLLCLVPHLIAISLNLKDPNDTTSQLFKSMLALRTVRILRIFKLMKHYTAFNILVYTIKVSMRELLLMVIFLFTGVLIFASIIFYVEQETFQNIPVGFWWALVTMTTVGYGDKVPKTEGGYIIGCFCVLCGILTVAFTVPIVVNNFALYYAHAQSRIKLPPHKRKELKRKIFLKNQKSMDFIEKLRMRRKGKAKSFTDVNTVISPRAPPCGQECSQENDNTANDKTEMKQYFVYETSLNEGKESNTDTEADKQERIHTISEGIETNSQNSKSVSPVEIEVSEIEQHKYETEQLLNDLAENKLRIKEERRRQLEMLNVKREQKRQQREGGKTPRLTPAPAAASKTSTKTS